MNRLYEFSCDDGHISEQLVAGSCRESVCRECGKAAIRIISAPQVKLEPFTGAFPDAYDKWARVRAEKLQQERKKNASEGREYTPL
jgi:hypothetical protein